MLLLMMLACGGEKDPVDTGPADSGDTASGDADGDGYLPPEDCDDTDEYANPGADDVPYDGIDQDCDGADLTDVDGDGYVGEAAGGDDCHDGNPTVHPGASEVCYNEFDDDCDGVYSTSNDCDGDGYEQGRDCDDEDATRSPDAEEIWYDGVDQDCDNADDYDQDRDGETRDLDGGTDCDDVDAAVNTEASEAWNGRDDDCDGAPDAMTNRETTSSWSGDHGAGEDTFGYDFVSVPDQSGDGVRDVVVGVPAYGEYSGELYLLPWEDGTATPATAMLGRALGGTTEEFGTAVLAIDDGAGGQVLVAGAPGTTIEGGATYLFRASDLSGGAELDTGSALATISAGYTGAYLGEWQDGSGNRALLSGNAYVEGGTVSVGIYPLGTLLGGGTFTDADATVTLAPDGIPMGAAVVGDADGDGADEVGVAVYQERFESYRVYTWSGAEIAAADAGASHQLSGFTGTILFGSAPDLDGDGLDELVYSDTDVEPGGKVWLVRGADALAGGDVTGVAFASVTGDVDGGYLRAVRTHADLDGDGKIDLTVCSPGDGDSGVKGSCRYVSGADLAAGGDHAPGIAGPTFDSRAPDDRLGSILLLEDIDGDADTDAWIGASGGSGTILSFLRQ